MKLYDFHPGDIFTAAMTVSGWVFTGQRFVVWRVYEDDSLLVQHIIDDGDGGDRFADLAKIRFEDAHATHPLGKIMHPEVTGHYKAKDEGANSIPLMADEAERQLARGYAMTDVEGVTIAAQKAQRDLHATVGEAAARPGAVISEIARITGVTRQTIYTWRDEYLKAHGGE